MIGNVARQSDHGSDGDRRQPGSKLFFRVKNRSKAAAQIAVQPRGMTAGVSELVQADDRPLFRTVKGFVRRHLNDVERWAVEGAFATDPNRHAACLNDELNVLDGHRHVWTTPADQGLIFGSVGVLGAVMSSAFCAEDEFRWP